MSVEIFIDTNILVYAHDAGSEQRHRIARQLLTNVWAQKIDAAISIQVLQEFYSTMLRKGGEARYYRKVTENMMVWPVIENTCSLMRRALALHDTFGVSFYDANILAAAQMAGAKELWTEDFNTGKQYGEVIAVNPLNEEP